MNTDLLLGLQWGDEGKGKIVDVLTNKYDIIARFQGGPNAGHTLEFDNIKHVLHTIPSGIFHKKSINIVGNGVVIDPIVLAEEIKNLEKFNLDIPNKLIISRKAHIILPTHRWLDLASETHKGAAKLGSTLRGIGPAYMDKTGRNGFRVGDLEMADWKSRYTTLRNKHLNLIKSYTTQVDFDLEALEADFFESLKVVINIPFIDEDYIFKAQEAGKTILAEGAQGSLLDIDFGTYPYVTSSTTTAAGACTGLGIAPNSIRNIIGIFKAYTTRVGSGPFPTELFNKTSEHLSRLGHEFGSTTGRPRRCGWLDLVSLKYAVKINGITELAIMKSDVLSGIDTLKVCTSYNYKGQQIEHLPYNIDSKCVTPIYKTLKGWHSDITGVTDESQFPKEFNQYIDFLETELQTPIKIISVGPNRTQTIYRK